jgi:hypothetical protein
MGQDVNIGLAPRNQLPIGPNKAIAVGHRHFFYLLCLLTICNSELMGRQAKGFELS